LESSIPAPSQSITSFHENCMSRPWGGEGGVRETGPFPSVGVKVNPASSPVPCSDLFSNSCVSVDRQTDRHSLSLSLSLSLSHSLPPGLGISGYYGGSCRNGRGFASFLYLLSFPASRRSSITLLDYSTKGFHSRSLAARFGSLVRETSPRGTDPVGILSTNRGALPSLPRSHLEPGVVPTPFPRSRAL